ncbi:MAG TPA: aldo/keto reductase [Candidatus Acidoferrales bacterium]|nr:aldo/keto reductase [Candidatus Acidoferrales bacterium]
MLERPLKTPALGFGCSSLTAISRSNANRVLGAAFDAGIRHFDVARYYGYGEAEGILGRFLNGRRSEVTITTKFGIEPPRRTPAFGFALAIGRQVARLVPGVRSVLRRGAQASVKSNAFSVQQAQANLETSLRELQTDYVDFYLLHDYSLSHGRPDELLTFLDDSVRAGKIGAFGIGTTFESMLQVLVEQPRLCGVLQFQNSVLTRNIERLPPSASYQLVITHGALSDGYRALQEFLETRKDLAKLWTTQIGCERLDEGTLSSLMLRYAVSANPEGLVLFSSRDPAKVTANVRAISESRFSGDQVTVFQKLVQRESAHILHGSVQATSAR